MTGNTHRLWAIAVATLIVNAQGQFRVSFASADFGMVQPVAVIIGAAILGALPDVDMWLKIKHRTITHSMLWPLALMLLLPREIGWPLGAALLTHALLDCAAGRVQLFWPLPWWVGVQLVKTGGMTETLFNVCAALWLGWMVFSGRL